MTLNLDFPPEVEARLQEVAARHGQDAAEFVVTTVTNSLVGNSESAPVTPLATVPHLPELSDEEFEDLLDELAGLGAPIAAPSEPIDYSREDIYFDHD